jgi:hypothetical protein
MVLTSAKSDPDISAFVVKGLSTPLPDAHIRFSKMARFQKEEAPR